MYLRSVFGRSVHFTGQKNYTATGIFTFPPCYTFPPVINIAAFLTACVRSEIYIVLTVSPVLHIQREDNKYFRRDFTLQQTFSTKLDRVETFQQVFIPSIARDEMRKIAQQKCGMLRKSTGFDKGGCVISRAGHLEVFWNFFQQ